MLLFFISVHLCPPPPLPEAVVGGTWVFTQFPLGGYKISLVMSGYAIFSPSVILAFTVSIVYLQDRGAAEAAALSVLFTLLKTQQEV